MFSIGNVLIFAGIRKKWVVFVRQTDKFAIINISYTFSFFFIPNLQLIYVDFFVVFKQWCKPGAGLGGFVKFYSWFKINCKNVFSWFWLSESGYSGFWDLHDCMFICIMYVWNKFHRIKRLKDLHFKKSKNITRSYRWQALSQIQYHPPRQSDRPAYAVGQALSRKNFKSN